MTAFAQVIAAVREKLHGTAPKTPDPAPTPAGDAAPSFDGNAALAVQAAAPADDPTWPPARVRLVQRLWGEGFVEVGGAEQLYRLAAPLNPKSSMSVLDMTAGLGGGGRTLHERFGVYVTGLEAHPVLARLGAEQAKRKGMATKASVAHFDPLTFTPARHYDCILAREAFFHQPHLAQALEHAVAALKPGGQILVTDYVRVESENPKSSYLHWIDSERQPSHPWTARQYQEALTKRGMSLRVAEDMTMEYRHLVLVGWAEFLKNLHGGDLDEGERTALVEEAELWMHRLATFEAGALKVMRFHAFAPQAEVR